MVAASSPATASTTGPASATPGGTGRPSRMASPRPIAFEPKTETSSASTSGTMSLKGPSPWGRSLRSQHRHLTGGAVDAHEGSVGDAAGGLARADHAGDAVLARHDRRVRQQAAVVGDDRAEQRQQDVERLGGGRREEHVALLDAAELRRSGDEAGRPFVDPGAGGEAAQHVLLVLGVGAAEERIERDAGRAHDATDAGREP